MPFKRLGIEKIVLLASVVYVLYLAIEQQLNLYIHPRYIVFTAVMSAIGLIILLVGVQRQTKKDTHHTNLLSTLPLLFILAAAIFFPARSLSSATVSQRTIDAGSIVTSTDDQPLNTLFAGSSKGLKLSDWSRLLQTNDDPSYYANRPARISGFIYDNGLGEDTVWLARFVLTCCAVDAQPVGIAVRIEDWNETYQEDEWVEVEGIFALSETDKGSELVLIPDSVQAIEQPRNPYAN